MVDYHYSERKEIEIQGKHGPIKRNICPYCFEHHKDKQAVDLEAEHDCKNVFYVYISKTTGKEISPTFAQEYKRRAIAKGLNVDKWTIEMKSIAQCCCWTKDMHDWRDQENPGYKSKII